MKTLRTFALFFALFLFYGHLFAQSVTRKISSFNKLQIAGAFNVYLEQGETESLRIDPGNIDANKIITKMNGSTLEVSQQKGIHNMKNVNVYITYRKLNSIERSGSGNFTCKGDLSADEFIFNTSGSGNVSIDGKLKGDEVEYSSSGSGDSEIAAIEAEELELELAGSGNVTIKDGETEKEEINLSGSGNISAFGLKTNICEASISGSGNIEIYANERLEGNIAGSGNIEVKGNAEIKKGGIIGSGRITKN